MEVYTRDQFILQLCMYMGNAARGDFDYSEFNKLYTQGVIYRKNGMLLFTNGSVLWLTKDNEFTRKGLLRDGFVIEDSHNIFVPDVKEVNYTTDIIDNLIKKELSSGNFDRDSIVRNIKFNTELQYALAFKCDPFFNDNETVEMICQLYDQYHSMSKCVDYISKNSKFLNGDTYRKSTFDEYFLPLVDSLIESYSNNPEFSDKSR